MENLILAVIGAQFPRNTDVAPAISTIEQFMHKGSKASRPSSWDVATVTDKQGCFNIAILAYWTSRDTYKSWEVSSGFWTWWRSTDRETAGHGWFLEVLCPTLDRFETVFSNSESPEGAAVMQEKISGEMLEHGYWGSVRDRLAAAQDDELQGISPSAELDRNKLEHTENTGVRVQVPGRKNLCFIRSGQDWSGTLPEERKLYLETMHPILIEGMNFLRDQGRDIGCFSMNLWDLVNPETHEANLERTFGLGYFDDLASLEHWSKSHQTHINIFAGFQQYAKKLNNVLSLRLYHEVYILKEGQQIFEYIDCHEETGMRGAMKMWEERTVVN